MSPELHGLSVKSGLGQLVDDVSSFFAQHNVKAQVLYGRRERTKQTNQGPGTAARVVFTPNGEDGDGGPIKLHTVPGDWRNIKDANGVVIGRVRPLGDWFRNVGVSVWAFDASAPENERKQDEAVEALFERVRQAIQWSNAGAGNARWDGSKTLWTVDPIEIKHGSELRAWFVLRTPIYDVAKEVAIPNPVVNKPTQLHSLT